MTRFLIFLFPAVMDITVGLLLFVNPMRLTQAGRSSTLVTAIASIWSVSYLLANHFVGIWTNRRNVAWLIISSGVSMAILSGCFIIFSGVTAMFVLVFLTGVSVALFFAPFQYFMKIIGGGDNDGVVRSTALYTFSWSMGIALGPFLSGYILQYHNWQWCMAMTSLLSILVSVGIYLLKHHADADARTENDSLTIEPVIRPKNASYAKMPDLAVMNWISSGLGISVVILIRALFAKTAKVNNLSDFEAGIVLFLLSGSQALSGLSMIFSRTWMYRPVPVCIYGLLGVAATAMFGVVHVVWGFYAAAVIFGIYSGSMFFYFVFHSLVHPSKSGRYVSINEMVVGGCGIAGPLFGGVLADSVSMSLPYLASAVMIAGALVYQCVVYAKARNDIQPILKELS
ncbi:MAG TPA: MFS transporter [Phycisphaerae bacterium]|nr:MFS transporter [Phycisphaerae bacterium]HPS52685.1 MFS transporter [Phycisphaerae bacterium]